MAHLDMKSPRLRMVEPSHLLSDSVDLNSYVFVPKSSQVPLRLLVRKLTVGTTSHTGGQRWPRDSRLPFSLLCKPVGGGVWNAPFLIITV